MSWVYVFAKFTPEALLLEALLICGLVAGYTAFWILRKRRLGSNETLVPASVVKQYLNELIGEANYLRTELFGLLGGDGFAFTPRGVPTQTVTQVVTDNTKLNELEAKMALQAAAMERLLAEKAQLERDLADAKSKMIAAAPVGDNSEFQEKISTLEARLAEYSVIEDDLANLKRLQQENSQLRAQLGGAAAAPAAAAPASAPAPARPATAATAAGPATTASTPAAAPAPADFDSLVQEVEKSLGTPPAQAPAGATSSAASPTTTAAAAVSPAGAQVKEKSDDDLIAEFEKMLKS